MCLRIDLISNDHHNTSYLIHLSLNQKIEAVLFTTHKVPLLYVVSLFEFAHRFDKQPAIVALPFPHSRSRFTQRRTMKIICIAYIFAFAHA